MNKNYNLIDLGRAAGAHHGAVDLFGVHTGRDVASGAGIETDDIQFNGIASRNSDKPVGEFAGGQGAGFIFWKVICF